MSRTEPDCLILGGGPAGCSLAVLLAQRGLEVVLVEHGRAHHSGPYETVMSSLQAIATRCGLLDLLPVQALADPLHHGAIWGSDEVVWRDDEQPGLLLPRGPFDRALRQAATRAGVDVRCPVRAEPDADGSYRLQSTDGAVERLWPRTVAIATGRTARVAGLPSLRAAGPMTRSLTLLGTGASCDRGTAMVEGVADGWLWTHVPHAGPSSTTAFVAVEQLADVGTTALMDRMLAAARGPAGRLTDWRIRNANDATPRSRGVVAGRLLLGDAAATIDPLASQGVEKAVAAAEHAAVVIATAVLRRELWPRLCSMHSRWEIGLHQAHARTAREFYQRETRFPGESFWQHRQREPVAAAAAIGTGPVALAAFVEPQKVLARQGDVVVERDGAIDKRTGEEVARIGHVPLLPLLRLFREPVTIGDAVVAAGRDAGLFVLSPRAVHDAITQLAARGWLVSGPPAAGSR